MSRYRLYPTPAQEAGMREHCAHARFAWNLAVEQHAWWRAGRKRAPGFFEQCRQLTEARRDNPWLAAGSQTVQQQALRDFDRAMQNFFAGTHRRPRWRKAGINEGFRLLANNHPHVRRLSRHVGEVRVPKVGWIRFRWSRAVPAARSYRVTRDRAGRWHVGFTAIPAEMPGPGNGAVVGVDRGVTVSAALSTGEMLKVPQLSPARQRRLGRLQRKLSRAQRDSGGRERARLAISRLKVREADARKDWIEKTSTDLARRFDVIRVENLQIRNMTRSGRGGKAALNRGILGSGWGKLVERLEDKAGGRVQRVNPAFTSQRCSACGHTSAENRKSQAVFACVACGFALNADLNAAINIAAGHAVNARGGDRVAGPVKREPQRSGLRVA